MAAMLEGWNNETVLHEDRSYFPEERKCVVFALQHGGNDETWKCSILVSVLAQRGYFKEQAFVNYLKYLLYWKKPEYAKFLK